MALPRRLKIARDFKWLKVILDNEVIFKIHKNEKNASQKVNDFLEEKF